MFQHHGEQLGVLEIEVGLRQAAAAEQVLVG